MPEFNPAHRTPPPETTPEEAERNKRIMGQNKAPLKAGTEAGPGGPNADDTTADPGKATS